MKNRVLYEILCNNFIFLYGFKLIENSLFLYL